MSDVTQEDPIQLIYHESSIVNCSSIAFVGGNPTRKCRMYMLHDMAKVKPDNWSWSLPENRRYTMMTYKDSLGRPSHFGLRVMNEQGHPLPVAKLTSL